MRFLLDTNLISETQRPAPNPGVLAFLRDVDERNAFLSVVTWAELRRGIQRLPEGARRRRLWGWLEMELPQRFFDRILPIDVPVADAWGTLVAKREAAGRPIGAMDALIAATAEIHGLTLVTHNTPDFAGCAADLLNPWA